MRIIIGLVSLLFFYQSVYAVSGEINVETMLINLRDIQKTSNYVGFLTPYEKVTLRNEVAGIIYNIDVSEGDQVKKGDYLLSISKDRLKIQYQLAKANLELAEFNYSREKSLFKKKISQESKLKTSKNAYLNRLYQYKLASLDLEKSNVTAAFKGQISEVMVEEGEYLGIGKPLLNLIDRTRLLASIQVTEHDLKHIQKGQSVLVRIDAWPGKQWEGVIDRIAVEANAASKGYEVDVIINNKDAKLYPGMTSRIQMVTLDLKQQIVIPRHTVLEKTNGKFVFVKKGDQAEIRKVITGVPVNNEIQVLEGLQNGDLLIVRGQQFLSDQSPVKVIRQYQKNSELTY